MLQKCVDLGNGEVPSPPFRKWRGIHGHMPLRWADIPFACWVREEVIQENRRDLLARQVWVPWGYFQLAVKWKNKCVCLVWKTVTPEPAAPHVEKTIHKKREHVCICSDSHQARTLHFSGDGKAQHLHSWGQLWP